MSEETMAQMKERFDRITAKPIPHGDFLTKITDPAYPVKDHDFVFQNGFCCGVARVEEGGMDYIRFAFDVWDMPKTKQSFPNPETHSPGNWAVGLVMDWVPAKLGIRNHVSPSGSFIIEVLVAKWGQSGEITTLTA